jgi:hypothetical protein
MKILTTAVAYSVPSPSHHHPPPPADPPWSISVPLRSVHLRRFSFSVRPPRTVWSDAVRSRRGAARNCVCARHACRSFSAHPQGSRLWRLRAAPACWWRLCLRAFRLWSWSWRWRW